MNRDLKEELKKLDQSYQRAEPTAAMRRQLWERLALSKPREQTPRRWTLALAGMGALAVLIFATTWTLRSKAPRPGVTTLGGLALVNPSADLDAQLEANQTLAVNRGTVTLTDGEGVALSIKRPARIRREREGVRIVEGEVLASVDHVGPQRVVRVLVSHGAIEVHGTRFTIVQDSAGGAATLHEGSIVFRSSDGRLAEIAPGATLRWPLPELPSVEEAPLPSVPEPKVLRRPMKRSEPLSDAQPTLKQVAALRSRKAYVEAARVLSDALTQPLRPESRELLSYELGSVLTYHLKDVNPACAHWKKHLSGFPRGRRAADARKARDLLRCP